MQAALAEQPNLTVVEAAVEDLVVDHDGRCRGVVAGDGAVISAGAVVLTTGTFLRGLLHIGAERIAAGRVGAPPAVGPSDNLARAGFALGRPWTRTLPSDAGRTPPHPCLRGPTGDQPPRPSPTHP